MAGFLYVYTLPALSPSLPDATNQGHSSLPSCPRSRSILRSYFPGLPAWLWPKELGVPRGCFLQTAAPVCIACIHLSCTVTQFISLWPFDMLLAPDFLLTMSCCFNTGIPGQMLTDNAEWKSSISFCTHVSVFG